MTGAAILVAVLGGVATFGMRLSFLALASRAGQVHPEVRRALRMIPPAALAALVAPAVLRGGSPGGPLDLLDPRVPAAAIAMVVMWRTRSVLLTIAVGMAVLLGLRALA